MLEGLVAWVLNNYLGKYVENLNTDQLSIALLQGEVELENLPLRKDALRHVGLPIQIRAGFIGRVKLQIPVRQIRSAPWVIAVEQLYVVAGPVRLNEWDEEAEENAAQEYKLSLLDAMEARWRAETETTQESGYYASSYSSWLSYGTGVVTNIIENLQLKIKDVHIRYEDDVTVPGETFVCGLTIESLGAQSCDEKWVPRFTSWDAGGTSFKLMELNTLAVYWDCVDTMMGNLALGELAIAMMQSATSNYNFLLSPVSAQAHIKHNRSEQPLRSRSQPRIVCDLHLDHVPLSLIDWQYAQMVGCVKGLNTMDRLFRQRRWRPAETPSVNPRSWWLYAANCHGLLLPDKMVSGTKGWDRALSRAHDNVQYVRLYSHSLINPGAAPLDKHTRDRIEAERSLEELRLLREIAMRLVRPPPLPADARPSSSGRSLLLQWFPQWWYSSSPSASDSAPQQQQSQEQQKQKQQQEEQEQQRNILEDELLDALADTIENNTILRRDAVFGQFNFSLKQGTFKLCASSEEEKMVPLIELQFEKVKLSLESRPRTSSHRLDVELGAVYLRDRLTTDSVFPVLVAPQNRPDSASALPRPGPGGRTNMPTLQRFLNSSRIPTTSPMDEPLFSLSYEYKPFGSGIDYRLHISSQSLDVVYNPGAVKWLVDFFTRPHQKPDAQLRLAARLHYEAMKQKTKEELLRNWEQILEGDVVDRKVWDIELNISAPQIIFVEHFCDKNALMVVVDFGKFHFSNRKDFSQPVNTASNMKESDEEDDFQTPCSTPPGSQVSENELSQMPALVLQPPQKGDETSSLSEVSWHQKLYDRYRMELGDLQILVGRVRDNWKYAHLKGTSTLHVIDRFNIAVMLERRRIFTSDPNFPSVALSATLPRLVVHLNENKVQALRTIMSTVAGGGLLPSPFRSLGTEDKEEPLKDVDVSSSENLLTEKTHREMSRLLMLQFTVEHLSLEVQSRGRSIAELQVSGVRASFTKRPFDTSVSLSVHSLLLADALQTFGPDFELLVASHKHVGMDSVSGSLRDSEPTSPTSPGSPDPTAPRSLKATSPIALTQALSSLQMEPIVPHRAVSPSWGVSSSPPHIVSPPLPGRPPSITMEPLDAEALITIEILLVSANCPSNEGSREALQVASIQFNNLDIIANQETIVELLGFAQRVFPNLNGAVARPRSGAPMPSPEPVDETDVPALVPTRTEVTFDFHRLNVLLLRAVVRDNTVCGRKIATATMSEAKIQATVGNDMVIHGSLGGLQVLDLTPEGHLHPRILSLGKDPLGEKDLLAGLSADLYTIGLQQNPPDAFSFSIRRPLSIHYPQHLEDSSEVKIRMASVWYTHSPQLVAELQCCVAEFQQYLTNLARSIKSAATEMAIGLVHARAEVLAQSLYLNNKLSASFCSSGPSSETPSPKRRRQGSLSQSSADLLDSRTATQTPYSPSEDGGLDDPINIKLDVVLDSPVVILPRCPSSYQVFVAHLGKISLNNSWPVESEEMCIRREYYNIDFRDMNVYSLDTENRGSRDVHLNPECPPMRAEKLYSCAEEGKPILHDTALHLSVERHCGLMRQSTDTLLLGAETPPEFQEIELHDMMQVTGSVVTQLKISLSRLQYEQVLDTVSTLLTPPVLEPAPVTSSQRLSDIVEEESAGISTLRMDSALRARMFDSSEQFPRHKHPLTLKVLFDLPEFTVELKGDFGRGEQGLVDLTFREFRVEFDKSHRHEISIEMCLRSLLMEDLTKEQGNKHRYMVISSAVTEGPSARPPAFVSKSCPNLAGSLVVKQMTELHGSLPSHLGTGFCRPMLPATKGRILQKTKTVEYPCTPPPSPRARTSPQRLYREDNLMHISVLLVDKQAPNFSSYYNSVHRSVTVDFNSLDIVVNIESWVVVLDFFNIGADVRALSRSSSVENSTQIPAAEVELFNADLEVDVKSITLVLNLPIHEVAKANISHFHMTVHSRGLNSSVEGRLGSMSLLDVSPHSYLYRERFISSGHEALNFTYFSHGQPDLMLQREFDSCLKLEMSSVLYIHTKRFVAEIQAFFHHFSQLRGVMATIRAATSGREVPESLKHSPRMSLKLHAGSPVIMLPVSSQSPDILVVDLGKLTVSNSFKMSGSPGTNATFHHHEKPSDEPPVEPSLLDVMKVELDNMDLYAGRRQAVGLDEDRPPEGSLILGSSYVSRIGPSLLREKCQLHLQVDRNLDTHRHSCIPDMSVNGKLSAVHAALDLSQYKLVRGLLTFNIGECVDDLQVYYTCNPETSTSLLQNEERTVMLIQLELENVTLKLEREKHLPLAGINFISSRLLLELLNDGSQDIDLVSQEILLIDTRFQAEPANKRSNVFTNILQPINMITTEKEVQAEVHYRRRHDCASFTILLKDMRLMAILDWWEAFKNFIMENTELPQNSVADTSATTTSQANSTSGTSPDSIRPLLFELKLNITSSEVVLVENTSQWDTNAVILKSNSVIVYRPQQEEKPLSCELNNCELFSCILGMEDDTALSIIDPVQVSIDIAHRSVDGSVLEVVSKDLTIRLSYHDMKMFLQILNSLPKQTLWARNQDSASDSQPANVRNQVNKLINLGFKKEDCIHALELCNGQINDAALWLTQNALPTSPQTQDIIVTDHTSLGFDAVMVETTCVRVVVIDDCRDADVPLLELNFAQLSVKQQLNGAGSASCRLFGDYYNRTLSGWEPFLEPWGCHLSWEYSMTSVFSQNRLIVNITSVDVLNLNITSTLIDLYKTVKENWMLDYDSTVCERFECGNKNIISPSGYRRRLPFVPYAILNRTGSRLWFSTHIRGMGSISESPTLVMEPDDNWVHVAPDVTTPFTYEGRGKVRHRDTHKHNIHQLLVKVDGWRCTEPVSVDKVGVYFRQAAPESHSHYISHLDVPEARIVFEVTLEGSAKKLVTVRSALILENKLQDPVEVKLENRALQAGEATKILRVPQGSTIPIPLAHVTSQLWVRPLDQWYQYCSRPIVWNHVSKPGDIITEHRQCLTSRDLCYRLCVAVFRDNYPVEKPQARTTWLQPGHTLTLFSPFRISNLLPYDLHFNIVSGTKFEGHIRPAQLISLHQIDTELTVEVQFYLDNFPGVGALVIPPGSSSFNARVCVQDVHGRRLHLHVAVNVWKGTGYKVSVSVPFWIYNRTGLPLVFRQEGVPTDTAGQFDEHEVARMVAPLMFSFADNEISPTVVARIGNKVHSEGIPQWCNHFHLQKGLQVRRLRIALRDYSPDLVYLIGIEVRPGRGRHRVTSIVTLSPRYQLHNMSSHTLLFSQKCFATTLNDPGAEATHLKTVPDCNLAWHWPRLDKDQLLCVRLPNVPSCLWSGGFQIDASYSLHVNIRDVSGKMFLLRVEVVLRGATFCVVFSDADTMPPPIRVDNFSEVPVQFYQTCISAESLQTTVRPHSCISYAWDEPTQPKFITLVAPGGAACSYDMNSLGPGRGLTYENFIYIAFTGTFESSSPSDHSDARGQQLVLEVIPGSMRVTLARKEQGARSQLWRMSGDGLLQHEGSSPPRDQSGSGGLVLDIAGPAPQPLQYVPLVLRRPDPRRRSTQTWRFTPEGRLCCAHNNMCVQAMDGFYGLRPGNEAVLGPPQPVCHQLTATGVPIEQAVGRHRLRPGSGFLAISVLMDGPTAVLHIADLKEQHQHHILHTDAQNYNVVSLNSEAVPVEGHSTLQYSKELQLDVRLPSGLGVSIISQHTPAEELLYLLLRDIDLKVIQTTSETSINLHVRDVQCDNQLLEAQCPVPLFVTPARSTRSDSSPKGESALEVDVVKTASSSNNAEIYKHLIVKVKNLSLTIEERLLLKLFLFVGYNQLDAEQEAMEENDVETQKLVTEATSMSIKRYYFGSLRLEPSQVRLSVLTSAKLPPELQNIKLKLGLKLIKFEDAAVDMEPYTRTHQFESNQFLISSVIKHFKEELKWQAAIILGSVDFLGNPLGLVNDVSEGMSGLIFEGNVTALLRNVTHGLSNSAAKVTESLSDGLGRVILDDQHEEARQRIRKVRTSSSGEHLVAGLKGLGFGLLGGVTSVFKQTYEGAANDGMQGFISGLGKGLVGTVTKPVVGMLDLASEAASAVRDSSRSSIHVTRQKFRETRCVIGMGGLLPPFDAKQSKGLQYLYDINERNYTELFIAYECLRSGTEDLRILISSEMIRVFTCGSSSDTCNIVLQINLSDLFYCKAVEEMSLQNKRPMHYIELTVRADATGDRLVILQEPVKRPRVRCDDSDTARQVSHHVNYAKSLFEERRNTLVSAGFNVLED